MRTSENLVTKPFFLREYKSKKGQPYSLPAYVELPVALFTYPHLTTEEKWLWMLLKDLQGSNETSFWYMDSLAVVVGWSRWKVSRAAWSLEGKGWLTITYRDRGYNFNITPGAYVLEAARQAVKEGRPVPLPVPSERAAAKAKKAAKKASRLLVLLEPPEPHDLGQDPWEGAAK